MKRYILILIVAILLNCVSCGKQDEPAEPVPPSESETVSPTESELPTESETETESEATEPETEPETEEEVPIIEPIGEYASPQEAFAGLPAHYTDYSSYYNAGDECFKPVRIASVHEGPQAMFFDKIDNFGVEMVDECIDKVYAFGQLYRISRWLDTGNRYCPYFVISDDFAVLFRTNYQVVFVYEGGYEIYPSTIDEQEHYNNKDLDFYLENGTMHYKIRGMYLTSQQWESLLSYCGSGFFPDDIAMETGTVSLEDGKIVFNKENTYTYEEYIQIQDEGSFVWWHRCFVECCEKYGCDTLQELSDIYHEYEQNGKWYEFYN